MYASSVCRKKYICEQKKLKRLARTKNPKLSYESKTKIEKLEKALKKEMKLPGGAGLEHTT